MVGNDSSQGPLGTETHAIHGKSQERGGHTNIIMILPMEGTLRRHGRGTTANWNTISRFFFESFIE